MTPAERYGSDKNTPSFLEGVHNNIKEQYFKKKQETGDKRKAKILQQFLRELKNYKTTNIVDNLKYRVVIEELLKVNPNLCNNLFLGDTGVSLEQDLAKLFQTIEKAYTTSSSSLDYFDVGTKKFIAFDGYKMLDKATKEEIRKIYRLAQDKIYEYNHVKKEKKESGIAGVDGKIDTLGLNATIEIKPEVSMEARSIIRSLQGAAFTDKNYTKSSTVHLGMTNPYRILINVTKVSNPNVEVKQLNNRFYRMLECAGVYHSGGHPAHEIGAKYFYQIRYIYELTGLGGKYRSKESGDVKQLLNDAKYAKFLVFNQGGSKGGQIYVKSTVEIVNNIFSPKLREVSWEEALFKTITVSASEIKALDK